MCGCKRRRAARAAWIEQHAAGGRGCGRGFSPNAAPPFYPPFMGGPFGRWRDTPHNNGLGGPSQHESIHPRETSPSGDIEKTGASQTEANRVSFTPGSFGRWRDSVKSDKKMNIKRDSAASQPPHYTSGIKEGPQVDGEKPAAMREALPPTYEAATKH
ncbi:uncharacterized protein CTRU02_207609 [Colletotrichum truncatum]|uniref:Uncharacterized protein n=1 Tax=Colletotrichum truncatum TaxID=5467 RepID=A0ACC3Z1B0_COLTU|nr:uncharacterized protein CTRU02_09290 [Colletotrichum truncatum]KAF6788968.1 hypothetical protein CTRU02_09290 [Colletotrichum truncatum]